MAEEPFMLVSLEEAKAKKLANVLSNETCTKLLNYLTRHGEGTESEIAKALKIPLSTVHYNLRQLVEAKLVTADEYHYSDRGREVLHYQLANKYIIIAPEERRETFLEALKRLVPIFLLTLGVGAILSIFGMLQGLEPQPQPATAIDVTDSPHVESIDPTGGDGAFSTTAENSPVTVAERSSAQGPNATAGVASTEAAPSKDATDKRTPPAVAKAPKATAPPEPRDPTSNQWWLIGSFMAGALLVLVLLVGLAWYRTRKKS